MPFGSRPTLLGRRSAWAGALLGRRSAWAAIDPAQLVLCVGPWLADIRDFLKAEAAGAHATTASKAAADGKRAAEESQTAGSAQRRRRR